MKSNIFLIGLMGSGKTTLGKLLARKTGRRFVDADAELVARTGVSIATIFEIEGEESFRDREEELIGELTQLGDIVLSTGGGAIIREPSRACLRARGHVVYLRADPKLLWYRTRETNGRPLLAGGDGLTRLQNLYDQRRQWYESTAHTTVEVSDARPQRMAETIVRIVDGDVTPLPSSEDMKPEFDTLTPPYATP